MDPAKLILVSVLGLICAVGSSFVNDKKSYALFLIAAFIPFRTALIFYHLNGIYLIDFPLIALLVMTLAGSKEVKWIIPGLGVPALLFLVWSLITSFTAIDVGWGINQWTRFLRAYLLFIVVIHNVNSSSRLKFLLHGFLTGFAFQALLGVYQWRYGPAGLWILEEAGIPWRAAGTFVHPAMYADYLAFFLPILLRLFAYLPQKNVKKNIFYGVWFILGGCALFASYARGVWVGFFVAILMMVLYGLVNRRHKLRVKVAYVLIAVVFAVFVIRYINVVILMFGNEDRQRSAEVRIPLNYVALRLIKDNAVMGVGPDNYRLASPNYVVKEEAAVGFKQFELAQIVHNSYLLLASELGIPGLLLFLYFVFATMKMGIKCTRSRNPIVSNFSIGILAGLFANLVEYLFGPDLIDYQITMGFWLFSALIFVMYRFDLAFEKKLRLQKQQIISSQNPLQPNLENVS